MVRSFLYYRSIMVGKGTPSRRKVTFTTEEIIVRKSTMERSYLYYRDNHNEEVHHGEKLPLPQRKSWRGSPSWRKATSTTEKVLVRKSIMRKVTFTTETIMVRKSIMENCYLCNRESHGEEVHH